MEITAWRRRQPRKPESAAQRRLPDHIC
jgi:hypothetical protein